MTFEDCSRGKVRFEVGQSSDFRVSEAGEVATSRHLSLGKDRAIEAVIYAQDLHTQQVWKTKLYLLAKSQQVQRQFQVPLNFRKVFLVEIMMTWFLWSLEVEVRQQLSPSQAPSCCVWTPAHEACFLFAGEAQ